jgi:DNA-binding response OmpR family regulator
MTEIEDFADLTIIDRMAGGGPYTCSDGRWTLRLAELISLSATTSAERKRAETATVLVVDDENILRETLSYNLRRDGFTVHEAADGNEALRLATAYPPDAVVLDVMLPGMDGYEVCRALRAQSSVPILLLSARGEEIDRVVGLEIGADDYLTKPFAMRELLARVRAMIRRARMPVHPPAEKSAETPARSTGVISLGRLEIDGPKRRVTLSGQPVALKPKEFDLLLYLARHPGIVLSRDAVLREVWGYDFPMDTRTVDVHIRWLRQKLEDDPANPRLIETVRGYGYRLEASVD